MMKRIIAGVLALLLLAPAFALAEVDLSGMTFDELVALRERIDRAMWECEEWQAVTVPQGVYQVGADIPAGHWSIAAAEGQSASVAWGTKLNQTGTDVDVDWDDNGFYEYESIVNPSYAYYQASDRTEVDFDLKEGQYFAVQYGQVVFTPYKGKPTLGFK